MKYNFNHLKILFKTSFKSLRQKLANENVLKLFLKTALRIIKTACELKTK